MMLWPVLIGGISGLVLVGALYRMGALQERSGLAVLLGAIAFFWPVFAVQADATAITLVLHGVVFVIFSALAAFGFRKSAVVIAAGLIAHGVFDVFVHFTGHPGPFWWPAFCGALDLVAGVLVIILIRTHRIPA